MKATEVCRGIELSARADRKQPCKPSDLLSLPCEPSDSLSYRHSGCFLGSQMLQNLYLRTIIVDIHLRIEFVLVRDFSIFIDSIYSSILLIGFSRPQRRRCTSLFWHRLMHLAQWRATQKKDSRDSSTKPRVDLNSALCEVRAWFAATETLTSRAASLPFHFRIYFSFCSCESSVDRALRPLC